MTHRFLAVVGFLGGIVALGAWYVSHDVTTTSIAVLGYILVMFLYLDDMRFQGWAEWLVLISLVILGFGPWLIEFVPTVKVPREVFALGFVIVGAVVMVLKRREVAALLFAIGFTLIGVPLAIVGGILLVTYLVYVLRLLKIEKCMDKGTRHRELHIRWEWPEGKKFLPIRRDERP